MYTDIFKNRRNILYYLFLKVYIGGILFAITSILSQDLVNPSRPNFIQKKDVFGRNYKLKWNGEIQFYLDDSYRETLPDLEQLDIHIAEANELVAKRKFFPAIRLLKGIRLCQKIGFKDKKIVKPDAQKTLNRLISEHQDKKEELEILTEPYGCYALNDRKEKKLFIESKDFSFKYEIDSRFSYVFPTDLYRFARKDREYNWKVSYFRILLPEAEKEETFESEYIRYDKKIFYEPPSRIMFSIGQTYHHHTLPDISRYPEVWDGRRGLSNSVKRGSGFDRREISTGEYETNFNLTNETQIRSYFGFETYTFSKNKGIGVFLTCPFEFQEECKLIWKSMK